MIKLHLLITKSALFIKEQNIHTVFTDKDGQTLVLTFTGQMWYVIEEPEDIANQIKFGGGYGEGDTE